MMKAPKCKICGTAEFNHSCSGDPGLSNLPDKKAPKKPRNDPRVPQPKGMGVEDRLDELESRVDKLEYRKKYMRQYMAESRKAK